MVFRRAVFVVTFSASSLGISAQTSNPEGVKPDNTKVNKQDRAAREPTADQQKENRADLDTTKTIRRSIVDDKSLSTYAHNVKIITQNGTVTLKGPVRSEDEKKAIVAKATSVVGSPDKVVDQMTIKR